MARILHSVAFVKDLVLSGHWVRPVAPGLQELAEERATTVLPALLNLFFGEPQLSGPVKEAIRNSLPARDSSQSSRGPPLVRGCW